VNGYESDDHIYLEVVDNGSGISSERLREIREELTNRKDHSPTIGIGLRSVHERIKMHFGEPYGLTIESEEGVGTHSMVTIPKTWGGVD
jgi:two-component system sensor histidine kinase YesM